MDQRAFVFAARGHCIKGKQCQHITVKNQNMSLGSKQSSLFSFYALPSDGKLKGAVVQYVWSNLRHDQMANLIFHHLATWNNENLPNTIKKDWSKFLIALKLPKIVNFLPKTGPTFVFATRGHCIKGKQCQQVTLINKTICLCSDHIFLLCTSLWWQTERRAGPFIILLQPIQMLIGLEKIN